MILRIVVKWKICNIVGCKQVRSDKADKVIVKIEVSSMDRKFTVIVSGQNAELKWQVVSPIICAGDAIGSVVILAKDGRKKPGELEQKMILCAAGFLGRQMEQ